MSSQNAGIANTTLALALILVLIVGAIGFVALTSRSATTTASSESTTLTPSTTPASTTTSSTTSTTTTSSETSSPSSSVYCVQTGIHGALFVRVVADNSNQPIEGANVTGTILDYCDSGYNQPNAMGLTNSTGYAPNGIGWTGSITVTVDYAGIEYTFPAQTDNEIVATLSIPSGVAVEKTTSCGGPPGCSLTTTTVTASSTLYVPPPTTAIVHYGCGIAAASSTKTSALVLVNTSKANNINVNVSISPALTLSAAACSHTFTNTTTPTACGVMCGGGIGYTYAISDVWKLNFSLSSPVASGGYNLTIAAGSGMSDLFPGLSTEVYLNSQQITAWYSNPPCYGAQGVEGNCMASGATSITIELPAPIEGGEYQLMITSGEYLVP